MKELFWPVVIALFLIFYMCSSTEKYTVYYISCSNGVATPFASAKPPTPEERQQQCKEALDADKR